MNCSAGFWGPGMGSVVLLLSFTASVVAQPNIEPVTLQASPEARRVLEYLHSIRGTATLAGQHVVYGATIQRDLGHIRRVTGKQPALVEFEIGIFERKYSDAYEQQLQELVESMTDHWRQGYLVAVCWHWGNPMLPVNTYENTKVPFDIEAALRDGTPQHAALIKDLDVTAHALQKLRDAQVPVLFRPLHEMCGGWFWWSMQGREKAQQLWKFIFDYYNRHHQLNNLLWVYSASQEMRTDWFPGVAFADVVGVDIYRDGQQQVRDNYDRMQSVAENRPVPLSECDLIPDPDEMQRQQFAWNWFTAWHGRYLRRNSDEHLQRVYLHERVITQDELPALLEP